MIGKMNDFFQPFKLASVCKYHDDNKNSFGYTFNGTIVHGYSYQEDYFSYSTVKLMLHAPCGLETIFSDQQWATKGRLRVAS